MAINISNILTQLNTKMTTDSSANTTELLRRVQAYNSLNNIGVLEYQYYDDLPAVDSSNIGQLAYVRASTDDSFGTFFFSKALLNDSGYYDALDSTNSGWQKIVLNANDSDNFADIIAAAGSSVPHYQGSVSGYTGPGGNPATNVIEKYSFVSDGNSTDVGDMTVARNLPCGQSSTDNGYASGGNPGPAAALTIDKFPFAVDANATDVGDLSEGRWGMAGTSSTTHGYATAGYRVTPTPAVARDFIERFPFASDANGTSVGTITQSIRRVVGTTSTESGYTSGGEGSPVASGNFIDKFPFATASASGADVGDLVDAGDNKHLASSSSSTHGYVMGGLGSGSVLRDTIQKFSFSTDGNATDVSNLTAGRYTASGTSSTSSGYTAGGKNPSISDLNIIDKFSFATETDATDVGDLLSNRSYTAGQQV